ncbi:MAG: hydrolase 1, exosortase A system-associated [Dechloromonas sp.]|nr:MAG: hydrolase 1, exosortase A system-associated [Dechloromonas sp.]
MNYSEQASVFPCAGEQLLGIIARPERAAKTGVLIVVGGPQYRAGSHRQFLLLSRALAAAGYPAMRFDYRGMGDSTGELRNFEAVDLDIAAAVDAFMAAVPELERVVIWGLCDAASAALLYWDAARDSRLGGLVLLNPWVRSEATLARAHIKHYYAQRLLQPEFWRKLLGGQLGVGRAVGGFLNSLRQSRQVGSNTGGQARLSFQERMLRGLGEFRGKVLLILSGDDYTAKEFIESTRASAAWQAALSGGNVATREVVDADHTFSSAEWRSVVEEATLNWLQQSMG